MTNEYTIKIRSHEPPKIFIGGSLAGGKVVSISDDMPDYVDVAWLSERLPVEQLAKITGHTKLETLLNVYYNPTADELYNSMYGEF